MKRLWLLLLLSAAAQASTLQVLCYHRFKPACGKDPYCVTDEELKAQLDWLKAEGWQSVGLTQVAKALDGAPALPEKAVMLSVDDGYKAGARGADAFEAAGFRGVFFVNPGSLAKGKKAAKSSFMTMEDVKALEARGHDIGSHGMTHANLGKVPDGMDLQAYRAWLTQELGGAKAALEAGLGHPVTDLAWPFGAYNNPVLKFAQSLGYRQIYTVTEATVDLSRGAQRDRLPRWLLMGRSSQARFAARFAKGSLAPTVAQIVDGTALPMSELKVWAQPKAPIDVSAAVTRIDGRPYSHLEMGALKPGFHFLSIEAEGGPYRMLFQAAPDREMVYFDSLEQPEGKATHAP